MKRDAKTVGDLRTAASMTIQELKNTSGFAERARLIDDRRIVNRIHEPHAPICNQHVGAALNPLINNPRESELATVVDDARLDHQTPICTARGNQVRSPRSSLRGFPHQPHSRLRNTLTRLILHRSSRRPGDAVAPRGYRAETFRGADRSAATRPTPHSRREPMPTRIHLARDQGGC